MPARTKKMRRKEPNNGFTSLTTRYMGGFTFEKNSHGFYTALIHGRVLMIHRDRHRWVGAFSHCRKLFPGRSLVEVAKYAENYCFSFSIHQGWTERVLEEEEE